MLGGADPVGVDGLDRPRVRLPAPAQQELLRRRLTALDHLVRNGVALTVGHPGRTRDDRHHRGRQAAEVVSSLLGLDLVQLAQVPLARQAGGLRLEVGRSVAAERLRREGRQGHGELVNRSGDAEAIAGKGLGARRADYTGADDDDIGRLSHLICFQVGQDCILRADL